MKKQLLAFLITFGVMIAGTASASLWSYYNEQGLNLPSIEERAVEWSNISSEQYTGSKTQNLALESYLRGDYDYILGATPTPTSSAPVKYVETPDFYAYSPAVAGDTTITLNDLQDIYGNTLTMSDFGDIGYGRIDPDGTEVSESFTFSGVTANSDGTYTLTGVKTVLAKYPYTQTSGLVRSHSINAIVRFTNTAAFYDNFANKENDEIIDGTWTFNEFPGVSSTSAQATNNNEFVTLYQLQQATSTGGVEASETVKGVGEFATQAEMVAGTATGGTGANLFVWNNYVSSTSATGTIPATPLTSQYLDKSFLEVDTTSTLEFNGNVLGVQATSTPTASKIPIADGSGKLDIGWTYYGNLSKDFNAGETIDGSTTPVPVYIGDSDGELYKADASYSDERSKVEGFIINSTTDGNTADLVMDGILTIPSETLTTTISETLDQSNDAGNGNTVFIIDSTTDLSSQVFMVGEQVGNISKIEIRMQPNGAGATAELNIYEVDSDGKPTGSSLASSTVSVTSGDVYYTFTLATPLSVSPGDVYALVIGSTNATGANYFSLRTDTNINYDVVKQGSTSGYPFGGTYNSTDSGSTWNNNSRSMVFKTYTTQRKIVLGDPVFLSETAGEYTTQYSSGTGAVSSRVGTLLGQTKLKINNTGDYKFLGSTTVSSLLQEIYIAVPPRTQQVILKTGVGVSSQAYTYTDLILTRDKKTSTLSAYQPSTNYNWTATWEYGYIKIVPATNTQIEGTTAYFYGY